MHSILIVDDDEALLEIAALFLKKNGDYDIDTAISARVAMEKLKTTPYDAIISDYQMPEIDGIGFLKEVRSKIGSVPFILFTGKGREEIIIEAINNGADFYIQKGGDPKSQFAELAHKLRSGVRRHKSEEALRINEERLRMAQAIGNTGSWEYSITTGKIWGSEEAFRIFGISRPEDGALTLEDVENHIPEKDRVHSALVRLISDAEPYDIEYIIRPADGSPERIVQSVAKLVRDAAGKPVRVDGVLHEVTDRKRAEAALRHSEERSRTLIRESTDGIVLTDEKGVVIEWNDAMSRITGVPREQATGLLYADIIVQRLVPARKSEKRIASIRKTFEKGLTTGKSKLFESSMEVEILRPDSSRRIIEQKLFPVPTPGGFRLGSIARDITDRRLVEQELRAAYEQINAANQQLKAHFDELSVSENVIRQNEALFSSLFESANDAIFLTKNGTFIRCNTKTAKIFGCADREQLIGHSILEFTPAAQPDGNSSAEAIRKNDALVESGTSITIERAQKRFDGTVFLAEVSLNRVVIGDEVLVQGIVRDISERIITERTLRITNHKLNLLSGITGHDIRNKITALEGYLYLAKETCPGESCQELFRKMESASREIEDCIALSQLYQDIGSSQPRWQQLDSFVTPVNLPSSISLKKELKGVEIFADPMLEKIFFNLNDNAVRHGKKVTQIAVSVSEEPDHLTVIWEDNGIGIPPEEKERIFEKGYGKNTGLGLFLSREILAITGITMTETGIPDRGTRFEIRVPAGIYRFPRHT